MKSENIQVELPLINDAEYSFVPDVKHNRIIYALKALCGLGSEDAQIIIEKRPYTSLEDFVERTGLKNKAIVTLIKAGAFKELDNQDTRKTMKKYLFKYKFSPCNKLTFQQYQQIQEMGILPESLDLMNRIVNFKSYVLSDCFFYKLYIDDNKKLPKKGYHDRYYLLDSTSMAFFTKHFTEENIVVGIKGEHYIISEKEFLKEYKKKVEPLVSWFNDEDTLKLYNLKKFEECWKQYASGTVEQWEMDALSFYYTRHELENIDTEYYSLVDFNKLPEEPQPYDYYTRYVDGKKKAFPKNKIDRIAGTVISKNNDKHLIVLLTPTGVVNIKFGKGQYAFYNRRISIDGTVVDDSWFKRGTKLLVCGYRRDSQFFAYKYNDTIYKHTVMQITDVYENGRVEILQERVSTS